LGEETESDGEDIFATPTEKEKKQSKNDRKRKRKMLEEIEAKKAKTSSKEEEEIVPEKTIEVGVSGENLPPPVSSFKEVF
jgi:hypothetical protein